MAYFNNKLANDNTTLAMNKKKQEAETQKAYAPEAIQLTSAAGSADPGAAPAVPSAPNAPASSGISSSGFQNYQRANQGAATNRLASAVQRNLETQAQQANSAIGSATNSFNQKVETGTLANRQNAAADIAGILNVVSGAKAPVKPTPIAAPVPSAATIQAKPQIAPIKAAPAPANQPAPAPVQAPVAAAVKAAPVSSTPVQAAPAQAAPTQTAPTATAQPAPTPVQAAPAVPAAPKPNPEYQTKQTELTTVTSQIDALNRQIRQMSSSGSYMVRVARQNQIAGLKKQLNQLVTKQADLKTNLRTLPANLPTPSDVPMDRVVTGAPAKPVATTTAAPAPVPTAPTLESLQNDFKQQNNYAAVEKDFAAKQQQSQALAGQIASIEQQIKKYWDSGKDTPPLALQQQLQAAKGQLSTLNVDLGKHPKIALDEKLGGLALPGTTAPVSTKPTAQATGKIAEIQQHLNNLRSQLAAPGMPQQSPHKLSIADQIKSAEAAIKQLQAAPVAELDAVATPATQDAASFLEADPFGGLSQDQINRFKSVINAQYEGPESLRQSGLYQKAAQKVNAAQRALDNSQSTTGREELLRNLYAQRGDYSRGLNKLDSALLNSSQSGIKALQQTARNAGSVADKLSQAQAASNNIAQSRANEISNIRKQALQSFADTKSGEDKRTDERITALTTKPVLDAAGKPVLKLDGSTMTEWDRLPEALRNALATDKANQTRSIGATEASLLGLKTGQGLYGLDAPNAIQTRAFDKGRLISRDEQLRQNVLAKLAGLDESQILNKNVLEYARDPSKAGTMSAMDAFDKQAFQTRIAEEEKAFQDLAKTKKLGSSDALRGSEDVLKILQNAGYNPNAVGKENLLNWDMISALNPSSNNGRFGVNVLNPAKGILNEEQFFDRAKVEENEATKKRAEAINSLIAKLDKTNIR